MKYTLALIIILLGTNSKVFASGQYFDLYNGIRPLGMGDAFLTVSDDENAHFYNPAGVSAIKTQKGAKFNIFNPAFGFDMNLLHAAKGQLLNGLPTLVMFLNQNPGQHYHMRFNLFPNVTIRNFSFGIMTQANIDAAMLGDNPVDSNVLVNATYDVVPTATMSLPFFGGVGRVGFTGRMIWRAQYYDIMPYSKLSSLSFADNLREGIGFGGDTGVMITLPITYFPSFAAVWRNIGDTSFIKTHGVMAANPPGAPIKIKQSLDVGYGMFFFMAPEAKMRFAFDYRDVLNWSNPTSDWYKKTHLGVEFDFGTGAVPFLQIRAGFNQFRWTAGLSINSSFNSLDFVCYGVELGDQFWSKEDRRYMFRYSVGF